MTLRHVVLFVVLAGCGGGGSTLKGTVTVEGGSAANVPVAVYGPVSTVALTGDNGAFVAANLPDGHYLVRATVRGALAEEVSAPVVLSAGKQDVEPVLAFKQKPAPGKLSGRVTVENGSAANVAVFFHGPQSGAATTMADGSFTSGDLPDGAYVVHAVLRGAEVEDATATTKLASGRQEGDVTLAFRLPAKSQVSGRVVFADGSDASNLTVILGGSTFLGARTAAMGAFSFMNVPAGAATLSVEAADTREGRVSVGVAVAGAMVDVGELRLTPVARVGGTVTAGGMPVAGALVRVAGTGAAATTNAAGRFDFVGLAVGDTTFTAETATQTGAAMARLTRGANADVMVTVTAAPPPTGTVNGVVSFAAPQPPTIITIAAEGTTATARPGVNGAFTLQVPEGAWDITATAPHHPKLVLGRAQVSAGQTVVLPGQTLSFYEPIFDNQATIIGLSVLGSVAGQPWLAVLTGDVLRTRLLAINSRTKEVRVVAYGLASAVVFSPNARWLAYSVGGLLFTYEVPTGQTRLWGPLNAATVQFSSDETTMFLVRGTFLERVTLSSGQVTRFPAAGAGTTLLHTNDRLLVRDNATNDVTLVEPATTTALFTNVTRLFATPTPMALTGCVAPSSTCTLRVVAPTGRTSSTVAGVFPDTLGVVTNSPPDYPLMVSGSSSTMVRASDGTAYPLAANSTTFVFNHTGTRFAYVTIGAPSVLREDTIPPTASPTVIVQATPTLFQYFTPTRLVGFDPTARRIFDVRSGVATFDSDLDANSPAVTPAMAVWRTATTQRWKVILGDEAALETDMPSTTPLSFVGYRAGLPVTEFGTLGFDLVTTYLIDGRANTVRRQPGGPLTAGFRNRNTEFFIGTWNGAAEVVLNAESGQIIDFRDARLTNTVFVFTTDNRVQLGSLGSALWLGVL